jgi:predicted small lipoprotein YifL
MARPIDPARAPSLSRRSWLVLALACGLLAACGRRGPLRLPTPEEQAQLEAERRAAAQRQKEAEEREGVQ